MPHALDALFYPKSIAVIGASDRYSSTGRNVFSLLLSIQTNAEIIPINNRHKSVGGIKAFASLSDACKIHSIDSAIIILAADKLPALVREASKCGVRYMIFINELDPTPNAIRIKLDRASEQARKHQIALLSMPVNGLQGLYTPPPEQAACAYIGQSSGIADCMYSYAHPRGIIFSRFLTISPQHYPVSTGQIIDFLATSKHTSALLIHISMLDNAQELMSAFTAASHHKPVVVLSTISDTKQETLFIHALQRNHIMTVPSLTEFLTAAKLIHTGIINRGNRIAIISNTPQISALALKNLAQTHFELAQMTPTSIRAINKIFPHKPMQTNPLYLPIDIAPSIVQMAIKHYLNDEHTDAVCLIYAGINQKDSHRVAQLTSPLQKQSRKPLLLSWMGSADTLEVRQLFNKNKNLHFRQPEHALHALVQLRYYYQHQLQRHHLTQFYDYRNAAKTAQHLHKQFATLLPVAVLPLPATKNNTAHLLTALHIHKNTNKTSSQTQLSLHWEKSEPFGQVLTLHNLHAQISLLPPPNAEAIQHALEQLQLPLPIWQHWLMDTLEILSRLSEIHSLFLSLYYDIKQGICCNEAKLTLQDPARFTASDIPINNIFAPYPHNTEEHITLKNKKKLHIRPVRPEDATLIQTFVTNQSEQHRYLRFMSKLKELPLPLLFRLSYLDYQREFALIIHNDENQILAYSNYTADKKTNSCEFGIIIADNLHKQGIGTLLMERLIKQARQQQYQYMHAEILHENKAMKHLVKKFGFNITTHPHDSHLIHATLQLNP